MRQFHPVPLHRDVDLPGGARLLLRRAGHILGASTAQIDIGGVRIVFSGDLGRYDDPVMYDPEPVPEADYVVTESTYGNRRHDRGDAVEALGKIINRTVLRGGTVVIPAFAVGRAQSLIHDLWLLRQSGGLRNVPVYLDSPMATNATALLHKHHQDHRLASHDFESAFADVTYVREVEESKALSANRYPKVIISASGMATGGRVLHHLKAYGPDPRNTVVFAGYQAAGTRGEALLNGAREVKIHGQWIPIRAEIANLPMLSAHADVDEIMRWLGGFRRPPKRTFIVHGEPVAAQALQQRIEADLGWKTTVSEQDEPYAPA